MHETPLISLVLAVSFSGVVAAEDPLRFSVRGDLQRAKTYFQIAKYLDEAEFTNAAALFRTINNANGWGGFKYEQISQSLGDRNYALARDLCFWDIDFWIIDTAADSQAPGLPALFADADRLQFLQDLAAYRSKFPATTPEGKKSEAMVANFLEKASERIPASKVFWKEQFGYSRADTNTLYCLMAHGYFRSESTTVQSAIHEWLKAHSSAVVTPVTSGGPVLSESPSSRQVFVWVVQGADYLNVELVRRGCLAPETQLLNPTERPQVSQIEYIWFHREVTNAAAQAKAGKAGIWRTREQ